MIMEKGKGERKMLKGTEGKRKRKDKGYVMEMEKTEEEGEENA